MLQTNFGTTITSHTVGSPAGILPAVILKPVGLTGQRPLVVLHGISRNAEELANLFLPYAERYRRSVIVPHFEQDRWPHFQRPCRAARPDQALLALTAHLAAIDPSLAGPVDLFGHSGGAQLAHRFAMLYPHKVGHLHLAAPGWYCLPDTSMAYPYGLAPDASLFGMTWVRRHKQALTDFLRLPVQVYVGTKDDQRDDALRQTPDLDRGQGLTRLARAETYVQRFRAAAFDRGIPPQISLKRLPGVGHDVSQAIRHGDLASRVLQASTSPLATAS